MILNKENKEDIVERLDLARRNKGLTYKDIATYIGISPEGARSSFHRKSLNEQKINLLVAALGINEEWLITGNGEMFLTEDQINENKKQAFALPSNYQVIEEMRNDIRSKNETTKGVPFYDVEFRAGFELVMEDQRVNPEYTIYDPIYKGCDAVVPAFGDSMTPVIHSGDKIGIKKIALDKILFGQIYAILTEEWRTIKYIRKSQFDDKTS